MTKSLTSAQRRTYRTRNKIRRVHIDHNTNREKRARLSVFRSSNQLYAQILDDVKGVTLASANTVEPERKENLKTGANVEAASEVGKLVAARAKKAGIEKVVFDRGRFIYHGRVKALAEGAREGGLQF